MIRGRFRTLDSNKNPTVKNFNDIFDFFAHKNKTICRVAMNMPELDLMELLTVIALIEILLKENKIQEELRTQILGLLEKTLQNTHNWSIMMQILIYRSYIEFSLPSRRERAMMQFEEIVKDWKGSCQVYERMKFVHFLPMVNFNKLIRLIAESYLSIQRNNCALQILFDERLYLAALNTCTKQMDQNMLISVLERIPQEFKKTRHFDLFCSMKNSD